MTVATTQSFIWTACPNGFSADGAFFQVSVHVAPRLEAGDTADHFLDEWPALLGWPTALSSIAWFIDVDGGNPNSGVPAQYPLQGTLETAIWDGIFGVRQDRPHGVLVQPRPPTEQFAAVPVISYPAANVAGYLEDTYGTIANSSALDHPTTQEIIRHIGQLYDSDGVVFAGLLEERLGRQGLPPKRFNDFAVADAQRDLGAAREFHQPASILDPVAPVAPVLDFHSMVALLGHHPQLLRRLGLVFDLAIPAPNFPSFNRIRLSPSSDISATNHTPWTNCIYDYQTLTFEAAPHRGGMVNRFLKLGDGERYAVFEVDTDGAAIKLANQADAMHQGRVATGEDAPTTEALPSMREAGFQVVQLGRAGEFVASIDRGVALETAIKAGTDPDVWAEDIALGSVLDVWDEGRNAWFSTSARFGSYEIIATGRSLEVFDEAPVMSAPTSSAHAADAVEFRLHETLARWAGWSLASPRPGLPIQGNDVVGPSDQGVPVGVDVQLRPQRGSLPRLRFGTRYSLRMRVMDIAGNVPDLSAPVGPADQLRRSSAIVPYRRFDPISSPDVLIRQAPVPGESAGVLVIRGNYDLDSTDVSVRYVAPPPASQMLAETHGMFDAGANAAIGQGAAGRVSARDLIVARESGAYALADTPDRTLPVPYLPDPLARRGALQVMDGPNVGWFWQPFVVDGSWPNYQPFELRLLDGGAAQTISPTGGGQLDCALTKADIVHLRLSSAMDANDPSVAMFGITSWASARRDYDQASFPANAADGKNWLISPFRPLTLIYAVRQPLLEPVFTTAPNDGRGVGDTFCSIGFGLGYSEKSTSRVDLEAQWTEPVDGGPGAPAPDVAGKHVRAHVDQVTLLPFAEPVGEARHEFHDTKHRNVEYWLTATSRFAEHFVETTTIPAPAAASTTMLDGRGLQPDRTVVTRGSATLTAGADYTTDDVAGSITFVAAPGGDVTITFLPPVTRVTPDGAHATVNVRSSARPQSPDVAYVVPISAWSPVTKGTDLIVRSQRVRSGIRVYLNRPWWSSGEGELLGVVVGGGFPVPAPLAPFVTQWGRDPAFAGGALTDWPVVESFPAQVAYDGELHLAEVPAAWVGAVGHVVEYDPLQDLWFCDVPIDTGLAYMPFIRLAVARYQPSSIGANTQLSRVMLVDFLQLAPNRSATIVMSCDVLIESITVTGPSYTSAGGAGLSAIAGPGFAFATLEQRDASISDEALGWRAVGSTHVLAGSVATDGTAIWRFGQIQVPIGAPCRIVIEQYEEIRDDRRGHAVVGRSLGRRLVYSDVLSLHAPPPAPA
jgi:hypothetical protein